MLSLTDLQNFSELMPRLYTPSSLIDFPGHVFDWLAKLIDLDATNRDHQVTAPTTPTPPNSLTLETRELDRLIDRFTLFQHYFDRQQSNATKISDCSIESNSYRLEGVYCRFLKPIEREDRLVQIVIDPKQPTTTQAIYLLESDVICLTVSRSQLTLTERDRHLLDLIQPHLIQAHHNAIVFTEIQAKLDCQDCNFREPSGCSINHPETFWLDDDHQTQLISQVGEHQVSLFSIESIRSIGLTQRESEVLYLIAKDKNNSEIAKLLDCSLSTVKKHLEHIYAKLDVQSRTAAVMHVLAQLGSIN